MTTYLVITKEEWFLLCLTRRMFPLVQIICISVPGLPSLSFRFLLCHRLHALNLGCRGNALVPALQREYISPRCGQSHDLNHTLRRHCEVVLSPIVRKLKLLSPHKTATASLASVSSSLQEHRAGTNRRIGDRHTTCVTDYASVNERLSRASGQNERIDCKSFLEFSDDHLVME